MNTMRFKLLDFGCKINAPEASTTYLRIDHWNDFSFVTMFSIDYCDESLKVINLGTTKIGFNEQTVGIATYTTLNKEFSSLDDNYFSLGQSFEFYKNLWSISEKARVEILTGLKDIVFNQEKIQKIKKEEVFRKSLLRDISLSMVYGQFQRALVGEAERTDFDFIFKREADGAVDGIRLDFQVIVDSTPTTNIHAIIGRNGVGKTTLLNGMISAISSTDESCKFLRRGFSKPIEIDSDYFSRLISVSFSAFDPFTPPQDQPDPSKGTCYFYIGLKTIDQAGQHKTIKVLRKECIDALIGCFSNEAKSKRWFQAIEKLGSDENFSAMNLNNLYSLFEKVRSENNTYQFDSDDFFSAYEDEVKEILSIMSSGHAIVLLTITKLVDKVQEKTLVLLDEPESHLHPPLLVAFIRALSELLLNQNGVAILATHSPVVLQEIPKSCVWKLYRVGTQVAIDRPNIETFAENVGRLTSEVFSLEVQRSGFHALLNEAVKEGNSFEDILAKYKDQLGLEGRSVLAALIANRKGMSNP